MAAKGDHQRLVHVVDACDRIASYVGEGRANLDDAKTSDAVLHCLAVIGEALSALTPEAYASLTSLPSSQPRAMRNVIVHEYWRVDPAAIWTTVSRDLPALREEAARLLAELASQRLAFLDHLRTATDDLGDDDVMKSARH